MRWGYETVPIGKLVDPIKKWDPHKSESNKTLTYIDIASVSRETKQIEEVSKINAYEAPSRARQLVKDSDVLVSTVRPNLNAVAQVESEHDGATASTGFCVLRPKLNSLDSRFLYYWVRTPYFVEDMTRQSTGASYPAVSDSIIKKHFIPLPPIEEQRRIAAILDKADAVRRKRKEAIRLTEDLLRATFLDMFGDPVTNPKGWEIVELGSVTESKLGKMLSKAAKQGVNPVPYLGNSHVRWRSFELEDLPTMDFTEAELQKLDLKNGDLLVCEGGEVGRCAIWREELQRISFQKAIHRVRCNGNRVIPEYLQEYFYMMALSGGLMSSTSLATIAHLTGVRLKKLPLPLPPLYLQKQFQGFYLYYETTGTKYAD